MRAHPATAVLQEMRSLRPGSEVTDRLDAALATKLVGVLRFRRHHFMAALVSFARFVGDSDLTTRKMLLGIVAEDQVRARELATLSSGLKSA